MPAGRRPELLYLSIFNRNILYTPYLMQEMFKIWVDRLRDGQVERIARSFEPSFLEIDEKELKFLAPVQVNGEAYLADQHLVIRLKARTTATLPCVICNEMTDTELKVDNFYQAVGIEEIHDAVYDFAAPLREALLIELPNYFECRSGNCPERKSLAPYLRLSPKTEEKKNFPFADLEKN
jgi:DUF177 domain-containing protein